MTSIAISAQGLSKQYKLGARVKYRSLRDSVTDTLMAPLHWIRRAQRNESSGAERFWALQNISFDVAEGEVLGIIGRNGAGKSTLLKLLSRITEPTTGRAVIRGRVGSLLEVGTGFHPELSGRENIYLNGAVLGMRKADIEHRFDDIVEFAEMSQFLDTPVKHYSSGMYMRLAFSVAAHLEPDILVVDEVLAVGDAAFQRKCLGKMEDIAGQGRTVLFVSHNMPAVDRLCTQALLLEAGTLAAYGSTPSIISRYTSGVSQGGAVRTWESDASPPTSRFRLLKLAVLNSRGETANVASIGDDLRVQATYQVNEPGLAFRTSYAFHTQGVIAFGAIEPTESPRTIAGVYTSTADVPAHLLAEGEYSVSVSFFYSRGGKQHLGGAEQAVVFMVTDPMNGESARGDYSQNMAGVLRPKLNWHIEQQS